MSMALLISKDFGQDTTDSAALQYNNPPVQALETPKSFIDEARSSAIRGA
jgi:hypothetical protein